MKPKIIKKLQKIYGIKLEPLTEIKWNSTGYVINNGHIIGLSIQSITITRTTFLYDAELSELQMLCLDFDKISNISFLAKYNNLKELSLNCNHYISDISALTNKKSIKRLILGNNAIEDISSLKNLNNLEYLDLMNNSVSNIKPLAKLKSLQHLNLENNQITNISPLAKLNIETINLSRNYITDLTSLKDMTKLRDLNVSLNCIDNIKPLSSVSALKSLDLFGNKINDISPINIDKIYVTMDEQQRISWGIPTENTFRFPKIFI
ncbi:MAG: leucine-rich repeat domain-containing protein [Phycisphaerae bacterium]|nr:leucine-rich repeat domain-containing protein [Phycisphaerae bacterium]